MRTYNYVFNSSFISANPPPAKLNFSSSPSISDFLSSLDEDSIKAVSARRKKSKIL